MEMIQLYIDTLGQSYADVVSENTEKIHEMLLAGKRGVEIHNEFLAPLWLEKTKI